MEIRRSASGEQIRLAVVGELDLDTGPALRAAVDEALDAGARELVIDLGATTFMDSSGLAALLAGAREAQRRGAQFAVDSPPGSEARVVITMSGTGGMLGLRDG